MTLTKESFDDVINVYQTLEPPGSDTWNPLWMEEELWHRNRIFIALVRALRQIHIPISEAKILDVGCGVGRSTRVLLELGARPENILGIDIRPDAISYAKIINPGISLSVTRDFDEWPTPSLFNLCPQLTVFSSISGDERRLALAAMMEKMVSDNSYIFWWDLVKANPFAGGDVIEPQKLFKNCELVDYRLYHIRPTVVDVLIYTRLWEGRYLGGGISSTLERLLRRFSFRAPSHCALLFRKLIKK
jgi:SAM-dependent methyltransferase